MDAKTREQIQEGMREWAREALARRERQDKRAVERRREKYRSDPEWAAQIRKRWSNWAREKCANDPEWAEQQRAQKRERYANDPEWAARVRAATREWVKANPEKVRWLNSRRRAKKREALPLEREAETRAYEAQLRDAQEQYRAQGLDVHVDHILPLARGGEHVPENLRLVPAAHNLQKGPKLDSELDFELHVLIHE